MLWLRYVSLAGLLHFVLAYTTLSDNALRSLPDAGDDFNIDHGKLLAPILIPRVPGTAGSVAVLNHFVDFFRQSLPDWTISFQNSSSTTPTSKGEPVPFVNFVATRDPPWASEGSVGRLALVAHYDSKLEPEGFIGATDSAAPCAMIMHAARSIDQALTEKWAAVQAEGVDDLDEHHGIQVLLLDGEEAFLTWTDEDSLYGARALAEEWETMHNSAMSTYRSPLRSIDLFVLLDLLGAADPTVPSYFKTTHWAYQHLADVEQRLRSLDLLRTSTNRPFLPEKDKKDHERWLGGFIGDDHVPFMQRGVEILHLIAYPFPTTWHTINDDGAHLNIDTVADWAKIVAAFAAEWMDLDEVMARDTPMARAEPLQNHGVELGVGTKDEL